MRQQKRIGPGRSALKAGQHRRELLVQVLTHLDTIATTGVTQVDELVDLREAIGEDLGLECDAATQRFTVAPVDEGPEGFQEVEW